MPLFSLEEALDGLRTDKFLIVVDNERRENEGDLVMPAEVEGGIMGPVEGYLTEWVSAPLPWCRNLAYCSPLMFLPAVWHAAPCCSVQIRPVG